MLWLLLVGTLKEHEHIVFRIRFPPQFEDEEVQETDDIHHATEEELTHALNLFKTVTSRRHNSKKENTHDKVYRFLFLFAIATAYTHCKYVLPFPCRSLLYVPYTGS